MTTPEGARTPARTNDRLLLTPPQWTQLMPEDAEAQEKKRINSNTPRPTAVQELPTAATTQVATPSSSAAPAATTAAHVQTMPQWQSGADLPERRLMVQRIIALTEKKRTPVQVQRESATALAKRIELSLYSRAGSLDEYKSVATLRRRLQSLVSISYHEAAAARSPRAHAFTTGKRRFPMRSLQIEAMPSKRRRTSATSMISIQHINSGVMFASLGEDMLRSVTFLPTCVTSLHIEVAKAKMAFESVSDRPWLLQFPNLEQLVVFKDTKPRDLSDKNNLALHAWGCAELDVTQDNAGEVIVEHIAASIDAGACHKLQQLQLVSIFTNTTHRSALRQLCQSLITKKCPGLYELLLGGNSISDAGMIDIAQLLQSGALPRLCRLDLRRNYIGEVGLQRIMAALMTGSHRHLKYLCMGGNLITDNCVKPLRKLLADHACPQMRFLGLEDNFLSPEGVETIIQAAVAGGMMPKLHRVSCDGTTTASTAEQASS
ncbi:TPA: hypothetical protein N0F65_009277 [Lagenidium giganteum]|uniref:Uncharacterized protein n=1 Tax=Lagenidium giganteum TaxID=4803 RepID=A0AAV2YRB3_9STRA|nr:TPA: hypothetical protein N0F65_009277 [Lagenidium giganteum]